MAETKIEWTDKTWNPITGCTKLSEGCAYCYAEVMARRLKAMGQKKYINGFQLTMHEDDLNEPYKWKGSHNVFVCSMADLFHKDVPFEFIDRLLEVIRDTPQHHYQILTKRAERMEEYFINRRVPDNAWLGVTVENKKMKYRVDHLSAIDAKIHFLSCEPLLEDLGELNLENIQWIIVGGESGFLARPMKEKWVLNIKAQAYAHKIPFFFKQWGTWGQDGIKRNKKVNGKLLQGAIVQELPRFPLIK